MTNPFFAPSPLEFGLPPFAEIRDEHYAPAFERGLAEHAAEIDAITGSVDAPTFDNTVVPLERAGQTLSRVAAVFFNKASADSNDVTNELEEQLAPKLAAHSDAIRLNPALYERLRAVYETRESLDPESKYLVERYVARVHAGGRGTRLRLETAPDRAQPATVDADDTVREEPSRRYERARCGGRRCRRARGAGRGRDLGRGRCCGRAGAAGKVRHYAGAAYRASVSLAALESGPA